MNPTDQFPRIQRLPPYVFNIVNELKAQARKRGEDIIDFGMGNPDQPTPQHIVDKMIEAAQRGDTHRYSVSKGIPRLRKAICTWYKRRYGVTLNPEKEAIVTIGSKEGLSHLALATVDKGDAVLVPSPSYPIHTYGFVIAGADIRHVPLVPGGDFFVELEKAIKNSWPKPKMLVLNFPGNPTAQCVELDFFEKVIAIAKEHGIWVIHDLAYADIVFDGYKAPSILQVPGAKDIAVEFYTLSKSYNTWLARRSWSATRRWWCTARVSSRTDYGIAHAIQWPDPRRWGPQECGRDRLIPEAPRDVPSPARRRLMVDVPKTCSVRKTRFNTAAGCRNCKSCSSRRRGIAGIGFVNTAINT
jgi:alanine-synthesizing transaminase